MRQQPWLRQLFKSFGQRYPATTVQIMRGIRDGIAIDYIGDRSVSRTCRNLKSALHPPEVKAKVDAVIRADVAAGKKAGPFDKPPFPIFSCSPIGAVPKRNSDKWRVIHHLSYPFGGDSINAMTVEVYQKLGHFDHAAAAVRKYEGKCWLIKLDVEAAYKQVPVRPEDWPLLGFMWEGKYYFERTLPFGLKSSCRLWELYATALHHFFVHDLGITDVVHYIDDFLFVVPYKELAAQQLQEALALCRELGIPMAEDKTEGPTRVLTFLGIELDTINMIARLDEGKLSLLKELLRSWEDRRSASIRELQELTGILNFACTVIRPGRAFLRRIIDHTSALIREHASHKQKFPIDAGTYADSRWWRQFGLEWNGESLLYEREWEESPKLELFTDACNEGFGARFGRRWIAGKWTPAQLKLAQRKTNLSMPFLELYAIALSIAAWGHLLRGKKLLLWSDCQPIVYALDTRNGTTKSARFAALIRFILMEAARGGFAFRVRHIAGLTNVAADALSRGDMQVFREEVPDAETEATPTPVLPSLSHM